MKKSLIFLVCLFFGIGTLFAQDFTASGVVVDESGEEVIGATVVLKGTTTGVATGIDGDFKIKVPHGSTLVFSMVGMKTVEHKAAANMRVVMKADVASLEEVVVTGYGTVKKSSFTGAATTVNTTALEDIPSVNLDSKLAGAAAGLTINNSSGQPGGVEKIRIRGAGSISASNEPLYVIDGIPVNSSNMTDFDYSQSGTSSLATLNSNDIESITVIKDAGAAAMYGSRAANGVVVVKTKSGRMGKTNVNLRANWGFSNMAIDYRPVLGGDARREVLMLGLETYAKDNGVADPGAFAERNINLFAEKPWSGWTNWKDVLIKNGSQSNYDVSIQTGSEAFNAFSSISYNKLDGISANSGFERIAGRLNTSFTGVKNLRIDFNSVFSRSKQDTYTEGYGYASPIFNAFSFISPQDFPYNEDGGYNITQKFPQTSKGAINNPVYNADINWSKNKIHRYLGSFSGRYDLYKGLYIKETLGYDYINGFQGVWWDPRSGDGITYNGVLQEITMEHETLTTQSHIGYVQTFDKVHNVDILGGYETEKYKFRYGYTQGMDFANSINQTLNNAAETSASGYTSERRLLSWLAVANYNYNETYYLGANFRKDGSSKFHKNKRWGNFWSVSGSWRLTNESFMEDVKKYLQDWRFRVSYGVNGNLPNSNYAYQATYYYTLYAGQSAAGPSAMNNDDLTWEKNKSFNGGIDVAFLNRFNLTLDLYTRTTSDLLVPFSLSSTTGFSSMTANMGTIVNKGVEVSLRSDNISDGELTWNTILNLGHNSNKLKKIDGIRKRMQLSSTSLMHEVGNPFSMIYTREYAGVDPETGLQLFYKNQGDNPRELTTDYAQADRILYKKVDPSVTGGIINNFTYKGIDLGFTFTFSLGGNILDSAANSYLYSDGANNYTGQLGAQYKLKDIWQKPGDKTKLPKFTYNNIAIGSSRFVHSTDHLRLKNITMGYSLPRNIIKAAGMSNVRAFISAVNLLTFKSKDLITDPEAPNGGLGSYGIVGFETPALRTVTFGFDITF